MSTTQDPPKSAMLIYCSVCQHHVKQTSAHERAKNVIDYSNTCLFDRVGDQVSRLGAPNTRYLAVVIESYSTRQQEETDSFQRHCKGILGRFISKKRPFKCTSEDALQYCFPLFDD